jgi:hypothetical protein
MVDIIVSSGEAMSKYLKRISVLLLIHNLFKFIKLSESAYSYAGRK